MSSIPNNGYIRRYKLASIFGVHVTTIDRWVKSGKLPRPIKLGEKITAFDAKEINAWLASRSGAVA